MFLSVHMVGGYTSLFASHLIFTLPLTVWMMVGFIEAVPVAVLGYIGYNSIEWRTLMAAATFITLPALALCVQRYIVRGLVAGAVSG
jgi:ABC-type glycerol-3-phosphate transport system permease component